MVAKLVAQLFVTVSSLKIINGRHKQRRGRHTLVHQKMLFYVRFSLFDDGLQSCKVFFKLAAYKINLKRQFMKISEINCRVCALSSQLSF
jgi:hypothetical protein